jgi:hypothetical protein
MDVLFGGLIEFETQTEFNEFIDNIDNENAIRIIEIAITYAQQNGIFNLKEAHYLYKSLSKLKNNDIEH